MLQYALTSGQDTSDTAPMKRLPLGADMIGRRDDIPAKMISGTRVPSNRLSTGTPKQDEPGLGCNPFPANSLNRYKEDQNKTAKISLFQSQTRTQTTAAR